ncbi:MAG TPA: hypothetical protein VGD08_19230, partial [Stellaceae bacterium]
MWRRTAVANFRCRFGADNLDGRIRSESAPKHSLKYGPAVGIERTAPCFIPNTHAQLFRLVDRETVDTKPGKHF